MSYQVALKRRLFTTSALSSLVNKRGEVAIDITKNTLVIFDGSTSGGIPLAIEAHTHPDATGSTSGFMSATDYLQLQALNAITDATEFVHGYMSVTDKIKLDGIPTGGGGGIPPTSSSNIPGALVLRDSFGSFAAQVITAVSFVGPLTGNASTVTNGVVTTGSYANPSWITSLAGSKLTGAISTATISYANVTGPPTNVSAFTNDAGYITSSASISGSSGSVSGQTASPTPNTVMVRDSSGRSQVTTPSASNDIANKAYVDANAGVVSYTPRTSIVASSSPAGVFSYNVLNITSEAGLLKTMYIQDSFGGSGNIFLEFTVDGNTPQSISSSALSVLANRSVIGAYIVVMDLPYKTSMVIRAFSNASITAGAFLPTFWRWVKN